MNGQNPTSNESSIEWLPPSPLSAVEWLYVTVYVAEPSPGSVICYTATKPPRKKT